VPIGIVNPFDSAHQGLQGRLAHFDNRGGLPVVRLTRAAESAGAMPNSSAVSADASTE